jgi:RNA 3'-terminal phosphate cyclase (ATP)
MITIDGSKGGGQLLRSSLALSMITGQHFRIKNIRSNRPKPGLQRQHLVCVQASQEIADAAVDGAVLGSTEVIFAPSKVRSGDYCFPIGSAGSTTLVLQTILLPLLLKGSASSRVRIEGGTHNPMAPPTEFLQQSFLPPLVAMGGIATLQLERAGFFPAGGGVVTAELHPSQLTQPLDLCAWGTKFECLASSYVPHLPEEIGVRELRALAAELSLPLAEQHVLKPDTAGQGNCLMVSVRSDAGWSEVITIHGERNRSAESVGQGAARAMNGFLSLQAPVGVHLQDQLLMPLLFAGGQFVTGPLKEHFTSNQEVMQAFLGKQASVAELGRGKWLVSA